MSAADHRDLWHEVSTWLDEHWSPDLTVEEWWRIVAAAGWTAPHLPPEQGGRGLSRRAPIVVRSAFVTRGALRPPGGLGLLMAAPTILTHGTPDQIERHVRPILDGQLGLVPAVQRTRSGLRPRRSHRPGLGAMAIAG